MNWDFILQIGLVQEVLLVVGAGVIGYVGNLALSQIKKKLPISQSKLNELLNYADDLLINFDPQYEIKLGLRINELADGISESEARKIYDAIERKFKPSQLWRKMVLRKSDVSDQN